MIILFAIFGLGILLAATIKAFKVPTVYYAPAESTEELAAELSCPKCRLRRLKPNTPYTLRCEFCGFTFSIGTVKKKEVE